MVYSEVVAMETVSYTCQFYFIFLTMDIVPLSTYPFYVTLIIFVSGSYHLKLKGIFNCHLEVVSELFY